jgi:hypothetical protein
MVLGLFKMLGYRFSPQLRDLSDQRFWRAEVPGRAGGDYSRRTAGHAAGGGIADHQPGPRLQPTAHVRPRRTSLAAGQAFAEYGRIDKTMHPWRCATRSTTPTGAG